MAESRPCLNRDGRPKMIFADAAEAEQFLRDHRMRGRIAYECPRCGSVHIGHAGGAR